MTQMEWIDRIFPHLRHLRPIPFSEAVVSRRLTALIPLFVLLAWALFVFSPLVADPDLWGHVRFGQDTIRTGEIVRPDNYSYLTAGQPWINHEWLTEVIYALAYRAIGPAGLIALNLLPSLAIVGLIYDRLARAGLKTVATVLLPAGICLVLRPGVLNVRPQVFTYLLFLALVLLLDFYSRRRAGDEKRDRLLRLGFVAGTWVLSALWANLHGGVLAGIGALYLWGLTYLVEGVISSRSLGVLAQPGYRTVIASLLLTPTALLVNPYGAGLITFLIRTATVARPEIGEWQGVRLSDLWSLYWLATAALTVAVVILSQRPRLPSLLVPLAIIALLPLSAVRHIPLFAVAAPVLAGDHFAGSWYRLSARIHRPSSADLGRAVALVTSALLIVVAVARLRVGIVISPASANFPVRAVKLLEQARASGDMATEFNWGEYVIWHLGPAVRVSVDGRRETVYSDDIYRENLDFMLGQGQWDQLVDRPETDLALVDRERPAYGLMLTKAGWRLAYEDRTAALFARDNLDFELDAGAVPATWPPDGAGLPFPVE